MESILTVFYISNPFPIFKNRTHRPLIVIFVLAIAWKLVDVRVRTPRCTDTFLIALLPTTKIGEVSCVPIESLVMQIYSGST